MIGLGLLMRSFLFTCILLPLALAVSLYEKKYFMEQRDLAHFGPKYAEYIRRVPFFLPNLEGIKRTIRVYQGQEQETASDQGHGASSAQGHGQPIAAQGRTEGS